MHGQFATAHTHTLRTILASGNEILSWIEHFDVRYVDVNVVSRTSWGSKVTDLSDGTGHVATLDADGAPRSSGSERMVRLRRKLAEEGFVSVSAVAEEMGVSQMTARRDLARLVGMKLAVRTHGGAVAAGRPGVTLETREPAFNARASRAESPKKRIAAAAATLVAPGQTVGLDVGTTALELGNRLGEVGGLSVFTNSLRAGIALSGTANRVYMVGGEVRADELSLHGSIGLTQVRQLWFDHAFVGVSGVTEEGFFDFSLEEAEMKRAFVERARNVVVLCDATKFERMSLVRVCALSAAHAVVTDRTPAPALLTAIEAGGARVIIAPGSED